MAELLIEMEKKTGREEAAFHHEKAKTELSDFWNPNTAETAANYLLKVLIEANTSKVEQAIQQSADRQIEEEQREHLV